MPSILDWALAYHDAGWCIVPAKNKRAIVDWKQYQTKRPDTKQIIEWFTDAPEDAQIALVTGQISNVSVIDIDTHKVSCASKSEGVCDCVPETVDALAFKCGLTMRSNTGGGGVHLFCKLERNLHNSAKRLHPQIDIRSEGGLIILPPSLHASGNRYAWDPLFGISENNLSNMMPFPDGWKEQFNQRIAVDWTQVVTEGASIGNRNATLASLIGKLLVSFDRYHLEAAWQMIWMWNQRNSPPIDEKELAATFQSIVKTHFNGLEEYVPK